MTTVEVVFAIIVAVLLGALYILGVTLLITVQRMEKILSDYLKSVEKRSR